MNVDTEPKQGETAIPLSPEMIAQVKSGAMGDASVKMAQGLENAIQEAEGKAIKESLGVDLPFDPKTFITTGAILRKGLEVLPGVFVDMKTITTRERMIAETLVKDEFGVIKMDPAYFTAIEAAILSLAILRINNQPYPMPVLGAKGEENALLYSAKKDLMNVLLEADESFVSALGVLYKSLSILETPDDKTQKKS